MLLLGNLRALLGLLGVSLKDLAKKSEIPFWESSRAKSPRAGVAGWRWRGCGYAHHARMPRLLPRLRCIACKCWGSNRLHNCCGLAGCCWAATGGCWAAAGLLSCASLCLPYLFFLFLSIRESISHSRPAAPKNAYNRTQQRAQGEL